MRYHILTCDYHGTCKRRPYAEIYNLQSHSWSFLCVFHYYQERLHAKLIRAKHLGFYILKKGELEEIKKDMLLESLEEI